ncbi:hypothetical protein ED312_14035 [Sinomicrobium pectinilyticum]|uniref:Lipocalin-like domain-containing protein n=1 Tax=Sinomicrobium pectinilyticum TaxID=1084421 RepID=A0A3N0E877_SINP1|nr:hypothetical protein [Sinomicrobium pectinilyticum]RNL84061.1 hypothetical protein ED312_14035 [Sinomicrobium pectinilyticum]
MNFRILYFVFLAFLFFSCSDDDNDSSVDNPLLNNSYPQEWKLFEMTPSRQDSVISGEDMEWQETYVLNDDDTFIKTRMTDNETLTGGGTFVIVQDGDQTGVSLTYTDSNNPIIGTCSNDNKEYLRMDAEENVLVNNMQVCDGPGLFYNISTK